MVDKFDIFAEKKNTNEDIAKITSVLAIVLILGYFLLTVKAVHAKHRQFKESYRADEISQVQLEEKIKETTYLKMMLSPDKVFKSVFK